GAGTVAALAINQIGKSLPASPTTQPNALGVTAPVDLGKQFGDWFNRNFPDITAPAGTKTLNDAFRNLVASVSAHGEQQSVDLDAASQALHAYGFNTSHVAEESQIIAALYREHKINSQADLTRILGYW